MTPKKKIFGVNCVAYIAHNGVYSSTNILQMDVRAIVDKIFQYF